MAGIIVHGIAGLAGSYLLSLLFPQIHTFFPSLIIFYIIGIIWAIVPDIPWLWGNSKIDEKKVMNIFWFHYWIDNFFKEKNILI